ncbi:MAG: hypothetical protein K8R18_02570 [Parvibaculum sp.]|uniref:hypothetical protein n=1 Tax=Parvibaculum sp. TaxID=2024848 RepID=UPI0025FAF22C|nr:hypothetical protein [Parvibaculum sp.]MCE9648485.1 hypothetical protein [Parvibaculum sp.]
MAGNEPTIETVAGLWRRSLIAWPDGARDTETWVNWMQGPSFYLDLRQPVGKPDFHGISGLRELDAPQLEWLASQEGFAGELHHDGTYFEWRREIDFQPQAIYSDQGKLWYADGMMIEEGKDIPYIEHWNREPIELQPICAMRLADREDGRRGFIMRIGSLFMYARARGFEVPAGRHLRECVAGAADLGAAQDLVDCEISQGVITSTGWIVQRSSLPYREGRRLDPELKTHGPSALVTRDTGNDGRSAARHWDILDIQGELAAFPSTEGIRSAR